MKLYGCLLQSPLKSVHDFLVSKANAKLTQNLERKLSKSWRPWIRPFSHSTSCSFIGVPPSGLWFSCSDWVFSLKSSCTSETVREQAETQCIRANWAFYISWLSWLHIKRLTTLFCTFPCSLHLELCKVVSDVVGTLVPKCVKQVLEN